MAPRWLRKGSPTEIKKCSEFRVDVCDTETADGCCGAIPCTYCLEWNPETGDTVYAAADFATNGWTTTIAGVTWLGYWERNYDTNECEFVVTLDDVEIYRKSCYEGQSCRDSSDSASATIDYVDGIITWTKYEPRPLEYVQDEETNCTVHFCDDCECSCECLCVTISEFISEGVYETHTGEICDTAYDCEPPLWEGTIGGFELSLALGRDEYGRCIINATINSEEQEPVLFPGCGDAGDVTITLADTSTITVRCKVCSCDEIQEFPCCPGQPFPDTLTLTFLSQNTECACLDGQTVGLSAVDPLAAQTTWIGVYRYPCDVNADPVQVDYFKFTVSCGPSGQFLVILVEHIDQATADPEPAVDDVRWVSKGSYDLTAGQCDPFYWRYEAANDDTIQDAWRECEDDTMDTPHIWLELTL